MSTFINDVQNHAMTIENDNGIHRCIYFGKPGTNCYSFRLITWPGHLAISGDMGSFTFARIPDMFHLFRGSACRTYLEEKLVASCTRSGHTAFNWEYFREALLAQADNDEDREQILRQLELADEDEHGAIDMARYWPEEAPFIEWSDMGYAFRGKPTYHFLWCLEAIIWGVAQYDEYQRGSAGSGVEVHGCIDLGDDIVRADEVGEPAEFWTVYIRDSEGFADAVCNRRTKEDADKIAAIIAAGLQSPDKK